MRVRRLQLRSVAGLMGALLMLAGSPVAADQPVTREGAEFRAPLRGWLVRSFDAPPDQPYAAGHRGLDVAVSGDDHVFAPAGGVVSYAGNVAGNLTLSIDHSAGVVSTYSYLDDIHVTVGTQINEGDDIAKVGHGHGAVYPGFARHLHFSVRIDGSYVDPVSFLIGGGFSDLLDNAFEP